MNLKDKVNQLVEKYFDQVVDIRRYLHQNPELSNEEVWTKQHLIHFLKENTSLEKFIIRKIKH